MEMIRGKKPAPTAPRLVEYTCKPNDMMRKTILINSKNNPK